ncbi:4-alpha-D-glucan glucanohydrolase) [Durusdinium trenchii]|uniref:Alpha-amylase n=1 Tax=Durusdinium trenchii TaxID=1381693 RepID=A0ABP0QAB5_9DINO
MKALHIFTILWSTGWALRRRSHSGRKEVFVHLFEWSWEDVAKECEDWLGPKGFDAVQVSPPAEHIQGTPWWTRYQPVTYNLTSRSGDEQAFAQMVQRCRGAGVKIYVDAVLNHCAASTGTSITGSSYGPRKTPIFEPKDFHHTGNDLTSNCGVSDFSDIHNVQYCDLQGLPDLCTDCEVVQDKMAAYLSHLVELGVAGVRLDAAKHIPRDDLAKIFAKVKRGDSLFKYVEVSKASTRDVVSEDLYLDVADVTEFNYYLQLDPMIADSGQMFALESFGQSGLLSGGKTVVFIDNHDTQRSQDVNAAKLTYKSGKLYLLATAFMLAHPYGYPQVMSSFHFTEYDQGPPSVPVHSESDVHCGEFQPWVCEHRWVGIANMVAWRKISAELPITHFTALGEDTISFCRGEVACVAFNRQESDDWDVELTFPLAPGEYCDVAKSDAIGCPLVKVGSDGRTALKVPSQGFVALHVGARKKEPVADSDSTLGEVQLLRRSSGKGSFTISALGVDA